MRSINNHMFANVTYINMANNLIRYHIPNYYIRYILVYMGMCIPGLNHISKIGYKKLRLMINRGEYSNIDTLTINHNNVIISQLNITKFYL